MTKHIIPGRRAVDTYVFNDAKVVVAGNNGEYILYPVDNTTFVLVDWRNGTIVRRVTNIPHNFERKWLMGTCPSTNGRTVVGVVSQETDGSNYKTHAKGFDGVDMIFEHPEVREVYPVLRSADKSTHVLITWGLRTPYDGPVDILVHRKFSDSEQTWSGRFGLSPYAKPLINGSVIEAKPLPCIGAYQRTHFLSQQHFAVLRDDGTIHQIWSPSLPGLSHVIWCKQTTETGLSVMGSKFKDIIQVHKLRDVEISSLDSSEVSGQSDTNEHPLRSWFVENLKNFCVLADHIIVALSAYRKLELFHFDRFCPDEGVYACRWRRALQSFRFPELPSLEGSNPSVPGRTRTSVGADQG